MLQQFLLLVIFGVMALFALLMVWMILRNMSRMTNTRGTEYPRYDDPTIESSGGFGNRQGANRPQYDDPDISGRGSFGRSGGGSKPKERETDQPMGLGRHSSQNRTDDDDIESRGSFGGRKD